MLVQDYRTTKTWEDELRYSRPNMTIQNYMWALQVFCDWSKTTPDELIIQRLGDISNKSDYIKTLAFKRILDFQNSKRSRTKHTRDMIVKALESFYHDNSAGIDNIDLDDTRLRLKTFL
ncbi:MAG: hypothetical protein FJ358_05675 [Thaumarchaeota archaeon]|nr:hypothetical protein [Nitrososphaerota archaeon]